MTEPLETWKNAGNGLIYVVKTDRIGNETHELVNAGKSFSISRTERLMNMDRAASNAQDMFQNGALVPVRLLEGDETDAELAASPNLMAESDMESLFRGHWKTFESKVQSISNEVTLNRLRDVANKVDATVRQVGIIDARLEEVAPKGYVERESQVVSMSGGSLPGKEDTTGLPVTPK